jgi:hypothetical protein
VLKLAFAERLTYTQNEGFRTPDLSSPFKALGFFNMQGLAVAHQLTENSNLIFKVFEEWEASLRPLKKINTAYSHAPPEI